MVTKSSGTRTSYDTFATLPADFRPSAMEVFAVAGGQGLGVDEVAVNPDGTVVVYEGQVGEPDYVSLSGIRFSTD
jgi:hypothetical protein